MRKRSALKFILNSLIASAILLFFLNPPVSFASHKVFQENFDSNIEGSFPNGWILVNDPDRTPCTATWKVHNGMAGIAIVNQGSCTTNIMPDDAKWNGLGDNYIFELDMKFVNGTDHNVAFRFTPSFPSNDWYDLHFQSPGDFVLERVNPGIYNVFVPQNYPNNQTYHIKIVVNKNNIKVYIDNLLVRDYTSDVDRFPSGRIALRAGTGADPSSETYFDNIVVTNIDDEVSPILPVPYFSQNALPWGPTEYDHASSLRFPNTTMDRWGCAVTSAAMVLNYHGMTQFPNGNSVDPGTLNDWLKTHKGYLTGKGGGGSYSYLSWPAIGKLTKDLFDAGKSSTKLMHKRAYPNVNTTTLLNDDLNIRKFPDILYVQNASTSGHFVVAKGITDTTYAVNDPEWNVPTLSSFNNSYMQVDRYVPSNTNLSYIVAIANPEVELLLIDPLGRKTGKQIVNGQIQEFNQIPDATYAFEAPISNPNTHGTVENLGTGVNVFLLPEPNDGNYTVNISSTHEGKYTVNFATFEEDGDFEVYKKLGAINSTDTEDFGIQYSQTDLSFVTHAVTFDSFKEDIGALRDIQEIKNFGIYTSLLAKANIASKMRDIKPKVSQAILNSILAEINAQRGKGLTEDAYQILLYDVTYLKTHL